MKKWLGLCQLHLIHSELGVYLITTNTLLPRHEGHLPALSNHQISNLRGSHEPLQPRAAKPDLWDYATSQAHQGMPKCVKGMLGDFSGHTKVTIYPWKCIRSEWEWSLPLQYQVQWTQGGKPPGWHTSNLNIQKQGIQVNLEHIQLRHTNNEHFPVCFIFLLLKRHQDSWDRVCGLTCQNPSPNWTLGPIVDLCKQYNSDVMIMTSRLSATLFRQEKPLHMHSRVVADLPAHLQMSPTYPPTHPHMN